MSRIAIVQRPPALLDRKRTLEGVVAAVADAARERAALVIFPEAL
jgi:predicted amidohydrolase